MGGAAMGAGLERFIYSGHLHPTPAREGDREDLEADLNEEPSGER